MFSFYSGVRALAAGRTEMLVNNRFVGGVARKAISVYSSRQLSSNDGEGFLRSSLPDVEIPKVNVAEYVLERFRLWPNKIAVVSGNFYVVAVRNSYAYKQIHYNGAR